jgi:PiT family inorganic phosphate transporter
MLHYVSSIPSFHYSNCGAKRSQVRAMEAGFVVLVLAVLLSYIYAFVGGFTDAANAIATSVGSRALSPMTAVLMAAVLEILGALSGTAVALTIGKGIVALDLISLSTVVAALMGTMAWSLFTYYLGIPVSETHGLIGAIVGGVLLLILRFPGF